MCGSASEMAEKSYGLVKVHGRFLRGVGVGGLYVGGLSNSRLFSTVLNENQGCIIWKAERWVDTQCIGVSSQFPFALILFGR